jgi:orotidine-5'-phosphate decarboxylase
MGSKVMNPCPTHSFKGASATPHLRQWARRVSEIFTHTHVPSGETTAHSRDASILTEYGPTTFACGYDGTVTSVTSAEMPTVPTFTTMTTTTPTKRPQATTATITYKSS